MILTWDPVNIQPNSVVNFGLEFQDARNSPLTNVAYDFTVKEANGQIMQEFRNQQTQSGNATHQVTFNSTGPKTITVQMNSIGSRPVGQVIESTDFNIVAVPEFPISAAVVSASCNRFHSRNNESQGFEYRQAAVVYLALKVPPNPSFSLLSKTNFFLSKLTACLTAKFKKLYSDRIANDTTKGIRKWWT